MPAVSDAPGRVEPRDVRPASPSVAPKPRGAGVRNERGYPVCYG